MNTVELNHSRLVWKNGTFDFLARNAAFGWKDMAFAFSADGREYDSRCLEWRVLPSAPGRIVAVARPADAPVEWSVYLRCDPERDSLQLQCEYRNRSPHMLRLAKLAEGAGRLLCSGGRVFHVENIKQMFMAAMHQPAPAGRRLAWGSVLCGQSYWADLGPELRYGQSEDQPFPALFCVSPEHPGLGLVDAQLSQARWYREVRLAGGGRGEGFAYAGNMTTRGVESVRLAPNSSLAGELTFLQITPHAELSRAFGDYQQELTARYDFRALHSPNREELVWGSWNLGIFYDCNEDLVLGNARIIREHFPRVKWVQIDAGWESVRNSAVGCPLFEGVDAQKFPRGLKAVAGEIKALGLRPALWCGMGVSAPAQVVKTHPEWFLRGADGAPYIANGYTLDVSNPEVRDFLVRTYRTLIREWGFEGIKLDFWTYGFEDQGIRYACDDKTSLQWREWWLSTLNELLPPDGYLQAGCNISSLSPFVTRFFDNIRYGNDVGLGDEWQAVVDSAAWLAPFSLFGPGRLWLPNSDSIGAMRAMDPAAKRTWLTFCGATGSALELGGDLRKDNPEDWPAARNILDGTGIGRPFRPVDFGRPVDPVPPTIWFYPGGLALPGRPQPAGMLCAFNWEGQGVSRKSVRFAELQLAEQNYRAVNYWTGEETACEQAIEIPAVALHDVWAVNLYPAGM